VPHIRTAVAAVAATLALPAAASAHVTLQPDTAPAGGFTRLDVRVPNERDDAGTVKVAVQMPPGFEFVSYEPRPGWKVKVEREGDSVSRITWSGGVVAPGQFVDFGLSVRMPEGEPGEKLTFKALQTYEGGEVVRWIGPEDADEPAPIVTLTATGGGAQGAPGTDPDTPVSSDDAAGAREPASSSDDAAGAREPAPSSDEAPAAETASATVEESGTDGLAVAALAVGLVALAAALGALVAARRRPVTVRAAGEE
jgi:periplasmic copper chaperone A